MKRAIIVLLQGSTIDHSLITRRLYGSFVLDSFLHTIYKPADNYIIGISRYTC